MNLYKGGLTTRPNEEKEPEDVCVPMRLSTSLTSARLVFFESPPPPEQTHTHSADCSSRLPA